MNTLPTISRRARWAIPAGAVALAGAVTAGTMISTAQASPELPLRTPAQLLASVAGRDAPLPALTGTVVETASLGLPQLPGGQRPELHHVAAGRVAHDQGLVRRPHAYPARGAGADERDRRDPRRPPGLGLAEQLEHGHPDAAAGQGRPGRQAHAAALPSQLPLTPQQAASQALKAVGPSTRVSVERNVTVAGQPAYQLVLVAQGQRLADRPGRHRDRRDQERAAAGPGVRQGRGQPGLPGRLHVDLVRQAGRGQLQLHHPGRRQGQGGQPARATRPGRCRPGTRRPAASRR